MNVPTPIDEATFSEHAVLFSSIKTETPAALFKTAVEKIGKVDTSEVNTDAIYEQIKNAPVGLIYFNNTKDSPKEAVIVDEHQNRLDLRPELSAMIHSLLEAYAIITKSNVESLQNQFGSYTIAELHATIKQVVTQNVLEEAKPDVLAELTPPEKIVAESEITKAYAKELGIDSFSQEEQEEMLRALALTIQKQFLVDVYDRIGKDSFKALEASVAMGETFYATTLKHVVPNYEEIFAATRQKILTDFKNNTSEINENDTKTDSKSEEVPVATK